MTSRVEELGNRNNALINRSGTSYHSHVTKSLQTKFSKLGFPNFESRNQIGGFTNVRFFNINGIKDHEKVGLASLHLEGRKDLGMVSRVRG